MAAPFAKSPFHGTYSTPSSRSVASRFRRCLALLAVAVISRFAAAQETGSVSGTVTDTTGLPLVGVEVVADSGAARTYSDTRGLFSVLLAEGYHILRARRLGFAPLELPVTVASNAKAEVTLKMKAVVTTLPPVVINPSSIHYTGRLAGYYQRLEKGTGGVFITRNQIDRENPSTLGQLLAHVPGITSQRGRHGITSIRMRGRTCWPLVWIDGTPMPAGETDLDAFVPSSLQGIELYLGSTTAPMRYIYNRDLSSCGTILLWSRGPDTDPVGASPTAAVDLASLVDQLSVFNADQVDRRATLDTAKGLELQFPPPLFAAGVQGLVIAEFVVDTAGRVEDGTVGIVSSTDPLFTNAVRVALNSASYVPAVKGGKPVRQLVQQPFQFMPGRRQH